MAGSVPPPRDRRALDQALVAELTRLVPGYPALLATGRPRRQIDGDLCSQGVLSEQDLLGAYARASGLPERADEEIGAVERLPGLAPEFLAHHGCLPVARDERQVDLLVSDPYQLPALATTFQRLLQLTPRFSLARRGTVDRLIAAVYEKGDAAAEEAAAHAADSEEALRTLASEAKIVRLVNDLFARAVELEASDIHVEPEAGRLVVRLRVDGMLQEILSAPVAQFPAVASRLKLIAGMNIAENRLPQDGRINQRIGRHELDIRVSTIPVMNGESIVLRLLRKDAMQYDLAKIGMNEGLRQRFEKLVELPHGMILVVGPTGSGKTTTLYSVMARLNTADVKIITIEDPVEYRMERLCQMQVNPKIGLSFASGLRNIVRQDPDIILVGEIRDRETAEIAIHAALTGHLVFSTLHTNDAAGAISRLIDMGIEGFLIASALVGVLSQRLVRRLCPVCHGAGQDAGGRCKPCNGSGFKGRTGIYELLAVDEEIRQAISRRENSSVITALATRAGMVPILADGQAKVAAGITSAEELARAVQE